MTHMKIKSNPPKREKSPQPISFRLSKVAVKRLKALSKTTNKSMTDLLEEMIQEAHKDTVE